MICANLLLRNRVKLSGKGMRPVLTAEAFAVDDVVTGSHLVHVGDLVCYAEDPRRPGGPGRPDLVILGGRAFR